MTQVVPKWRAVLLDFLERAGWSAGQVFVATLLAGGVSSVTELPWKYSVTIAIGAFISSVILTGVQYLSKMTNLAFWPDLLVRLAKTFLSSLAGSMTAAVLKIHLPLASGQATLSMSYFTDFLSLVLLGPNEAMLVAASSAATQSIVSKKGKLSLRQTAFSSASLIITVQAAGFVAAQLGGFNLDATFSAIAKPAAGGAAA